MLQIALLQEVAGPRLNMVGRVTCATRTSLKIRIYGDRSERGSHFLSLMERLREDLLQRLRPKVFMHSRSERRRESPSCSNVTAPHNKHATCMNGLAHLQSPFPGGGTGGYLMPCMVRLHPRGA